MSFGRLTLPRVKEDVRISVSAEPDLLKFTLHLSTDIAEFYLNGKGRALDVCRNDSYLLSPAADAVLSLHGGQGIDEYSLFCGTEQMAVILDEYHIKPRGALARIIDHPDDDRLCVRCQPGGAAVLATRQLVSTDYNGGLKDLYLQSKLMEILALRIAEFSDSTKPRSGEEMFSTSDLAHIEEARDILIAEFISPPGITELSRRVGLNTSKLKLGFRLHFGYTVFGFVRSCRMEY